MIKSKIQEEIKVDEGNITQQNILHALSNPTPESTAFIMECEK